MGLTPILNFPRLGMAFKKLLVENTELQITVLLLTFFYWYGVSGDDEREQKYLYDKAFPIELLLYKKQEILNYLTNNRVLCYDDPVDNYKYITTFLYKNKITL